MKLAIVLAVAVMSVPLTTVFEPQQRKPMIEVPVLIDRRPPPETLAELLANVDQAVHVRILSAAPRRREVPGGSVPETVFVAEIIEKGRARRSSRVGERLRIVQDGGQFEEADRIERIAEEYNPPLVTGRAYLLTLNWNDFLDAYLLSHGPEGVFEIDGGRVSPRGKGRAARELGGKSLSQAIRLIK